MNNTLKLLPLAIPLMLGLPGGAANANTVNAPILGSSVYSFTNTFFVSDSDYVSEESIFSDTINFSLDSAQTVTFFADIFSGAFKFHQIDLLYADLVGPGNYLYGISEDVGPFNFSHYLLPGNYQVNYKGIPDVWNGTPDSNLEGNYLAGVSLNTLAVPEPETYFMLLAGLVLIGFSARRRDGSERLV